MVGVPRAGALDEGGDLHRAAVGLAGDRAVAQHRLQLDAGDHVGRGAVAQMPQLVGVVGPPTGGDDDGARLDVGIAALVPDVDLELARHALGPGDRGLGHDRDPGVGLDRRDQVFHVVGLGVAVGRPVGHPPAPLARPAAELGGAFHQKHLVAQRGGLARRGEPRDSAAHHQDAAAEGSFRQGLGRRAVGGLGKGHAQVVGGHRLGVRVVARVGPDHLLADVGTDHVGAVEGEAVGHHPVRAGDDDRLVDAALGDVLANGVDAVLAAQAVMLAAKPGRNRRRRHRLQRVDRDRLADAAALAQIDAGSSGFHHTSRCTGRRRRRPPGPPAGRRRSPTGPTRPRRSARPRPRPGTCRSRRRGWV